MPQIQAFVWAAGIQPVPQIRAQVRMILLGLPRTTGDLPGDLRSTLAPLVQCLDLDPVIERQMSLLRQTRSSLEKSFEGLEDLFRGFGPDERLRVLVPRPHPLADICLQRLDVAMV